MPAHLTLSTPLHRSHRSETPEIHCCCAHSGGKIVSREFPGHSPVFSRGAARVTPCGGGGPGRRSRSAPTLERRRPSSKGPMVVRDPGHSPQAGPRSWPEPFDDASRDFVGGGCSRNGGGATGRVRATAVQRRATTAPAPQQHATTRTDGTGTSGGLTPDTARNRQSEPRPATTPPDARNRPTAT